jgi:hypothetical protein
MEGGPRVACGLEAKPVSPSDHIPATKPGNSPWPSFLHQEKTSEGTMTKLTKQNVKPMKEGIYSTPKRITKIG